MIFSEFATYLSSIEATPSRNSITELLALLFSKASGTEIGNLCYLLEGRVAPLYEPVEFGMAEKFVLRSIALSCGVEIDEVVRVWKRHGDVGIVAETLHRGSGEALHVSDVYEVLLVIAKTSGVGSQEKKISLLSSLFSRLDAKSVRFVARIPLDKLRLGFTELTMLDALSYMLVKDKSLRPALEAAYSVLPDIGYIATKVKEQGIAAVSRIHVRLGSPVLAQLCQRLPDADEMIKKMAHVAVEPKYDGVRVQIHFQRGKGFKTFSRNLEQTTDMFPELSSIGDELSADTAILDCEAVGTDPATGALVSFQETTTRKRKHGIEGAQRLVPIRFFVFDILYKDGKDLLSVARNVRRDILEKTVREGALLSLSPQIEASDAASIRSYHEKQIANGLEGVVVKKWDSPYEPGRRGYSWVKFKEEEGAEGKLTDTIDAVIMGYYRGEGKRTQFGIGAFLVGVRDGDSIVSVTKIGTGVSDEQWRELHRMLHPLEQSKKPKEYADLVTQLIPDVWVTPNIVVEIAGDDLTKSTTHKAGIAVRFPRLVRVRTDKTSREVTTTAELAQMFAAQATPKRKN